MAFNEIATVPIMRYQYNVIVIKCVLLATWYLEYVEQFLNERNNADSAVYINPRGLKRQIYVSHGSTRCTKWEVLDLIVRRKLVTMDVSDFGTTTDKASSLDISELYEGTVEHPTRASRRWDEP